MKNVLFICLAAVLLNSACRPDRPPPRHHPGQRLDRLIEHLSKDLNLTPQQRDEIEALRIGLHERQRAMHRYRRTHMENIIATVRRDSVTVEDLRELDRAMEVRRRARKEFIMKRFVRIHATLSPEQRRQFADRLEAVHRKKLDRMRKRKGRPPPGPPGRANEGPETPRPPDA